MNKTQLQKIEAKLKRKGYKKYTTAITSSESWSWFKTFGKDDNENMPTQGYQVAFRIWDFTKYKLKPKEAYAIDFWTSPIWRETRVDFRQNWEPDDSIEKFECLAEELDKFLQKHCNFKAKTEHEK